tara:strand:- start:2711 stop:2926 length:216 start_codon:yes stop_codon:yes gene_type:complete
MIYKQVVLLIIPVVIALSWWLVQGYINSEVQNQHLKNEKVIEETIKDAIKNPTNKPDVALDRLRDTLSNWN